MKALHIRIICLAAVMALLFSLAACAGQPQGDDGAPALTGCPVIEDDKFGGVYIDVSPEDFEALGFEYGDSVDIVFSNGYEMHDVPYYNYYYVKMYEPILIAYPGYERIKAAINCGDSLWIEAGLTDADTADITLFEKAKYREIWENRNISYTNNREDYESDAVFANFRGVEAGEIAPGVLYRSASPCDNKFSRAAYTDRLISEAKIGFIMNLSDSDEDIKGYIAEEDFDSPYFLSLYENGMVCPLSMNANYGSEDFAKKAAAGFTAMAHSDGPYLIHCLEGKDRTGFVCVLAEALMGATREEITDDYMITYKNYYGITAESDPTRYEVNKMQVDDMLDLLTNNYGGGTGDLAACAEDYLISQGGMSADDIALLKEKLSSAVE